MGEREDGKVGERFGVCVCVCVCVFVVQVQPPHCALILSQHAAIARARARAHTHTHTHTHTLESIVKEIATPRGWYRTYDKFVSGEAVNKELQARCLLARAHTHTTHLHTHT